MRSESSTAAPDLALFNQDYVEVSSKRSASEGRNGTANVVLTPDRSGTGVRSTES